MIRNKIDMLFAKYDQDGTGFLGQQEFLASFNELCHDLNMPPPQSFDQVMNIAQSIDTNFDGRISKM